MKHLPASGRVALGAALFCLVMGGFVMSGWWLDIPAFKVLVSARGVMQANSALCFILAGAAMALNTSPEVACGSRESQRASLEAANKELEAFSDYVSHDLRAPLRHIDGFAGLLKRSSTEKLDEKEARYLPLITESAKRMGRLIDDLLDFSRRGRAEMRRDTVDMASLVLVVQHELEQDTQGRVIEWRVANLPAAHGDAALLRQVWTNLFSKAVKYSRLPARAVIEIGCKKDQASELIFFVRDNGVGFEMKYASHLFGVWQRLHRPGDFEGTGIGLANVRRITARHGGRTWAEGQPDAGATIWFTLPKLASEEKDLKTPAPGASDNHSTT